MRALLVLVLASCAHDLEVFERVDVQTARDLDILYVFDNSSDRASYTQMASQLGDLQTELAAVDGQLPNLHVGVVTTDLGTRGTMDMAPGAAFRNCAGAGDDGKLTTFFTPLEGPFLSDTRGPDNTRIQNFAGGDLTAELTLLTNPAGVKTGCEFAQPLEAMRRALDPAANPGFIRAGALLSVVFLTNDDDCSFKRSALTSTGTFACTSEGVVCDDGSPIRGGVHTNCRPREDSTLMTGVAEYKEFLSTLKTDKRDITVSAVAGARTPFVTLDSGLLVLSCAGAAAQAKPAVRIGSLVDSFGGALVDVCTQTSAYAQLAAPIVNRQSTCFRNLRATDGDDCIVLDQAPDGTEVELPPCGTGDSATPCWRKVADEVACPLGEHLSISIDRGNSTAPLTSQVKATCTLK